VEIIILSDILDVEKAPKFIEYVSIDAEGSEYEIRSAFDRNFRTCGAIHVEFNFNESKRMQIQELLTSYLYVHKKQILGVVKIHRF
jgi:hypothetical protein